MALALLGAWRAQVRNKGSQKWVLFSAEAALGVEEGGEGEEVKDNEILK